MSRTTSPPHNRISESPLPPTQGGILRNRILHISPIYGGWGASYVAAVRLMRAGTFWRWSRPLPRWISSEQVTN